MNSTHLLASALAGLGLGLSLIVAIGAQNGFVLHQGIRRDHILAVVLICIVSDAVLIAAGVAGAGALFTAMPWLVTLARWGGAVFLLGYAVLATRRALRRPDPQTSALQIDRAPTDDQRPDALDFPRHEATQPPRPDDAGKLGTVSLAIDSPATTAEPPVLSSRLPKVAGTALALTWLNPHVYLDTFVLLGSIGSSHGEARWAFAAGAILGSTLWFTSLGLAARALAPVFARPNSWRILDATIAAIMTTLAVSLILGG